MCLCVTYTTAADCTLQHSSIVNSNRWEIRLELVFVMAACHDTRFSKLLRHEDVWDGNKKQLTLKLMLMSFDSVRLTNPYLKNIWIEQILLDHPGPYFLLRFTLPLLLCVYLIYLLIYKHILLLNNVIWIIIAINT